MQLQTVDSRLWTADCGCQRAAHHVERRGFARPDFKRLRALMQQHAQAVGGLHPAFRAAFNNGVSAGR